MKKPKNKNTKAYQQWELRSLKKKAFKLWSTIVKNRAGNTCELCGFKGKGLQSHHIEDYRLCSALRYSPENGICVDPGCHKFRQKSCHHSFIILYDFLTKNRANDIDYLRAHCNDDVGEYTKEKMVSIISKLEIEM
jgi:hypothetical protein